MSRTAGATTGCEKSLVDQIDPNSRSRTSSGDPGSVLECGFDGPLARPRARFFCIRVIFSMK